MESLDNLDWNLIGVVLAAITLIATIVIFFLQKNKKRLSYEIIADTFLLTRKEKLEGKIKILYNDNEVKNVKFIEMKIINTGNVGIPAADYERALRLKFQEPTIVLNTEILENHPETLATSVKVENSDVVIEPFLMNSKDYFILKIIIANADAKKSKLMEG